MTKKSSNTCNLSNEEIIATIDRVAKKLAARFRFGYHQVQDIEQQARLIAWKGIEKYDGVRPLENYLWIHVHNRLFNFKRDNFFRPDDPCNNCSFYSPLSIDKKCDKYDDIYECKMYARCHRRNTVKLNLTYPIEFSCVDDYSEDNMRSDQSIERTAVNNELRSILNYYIPIKYRHSYLRLLYGCCISSQRKNRLYDLIREIVNEYYSDFFKV